MMHLKMQLNKVFSILYKIISLGIQIKLLANKKNEHMLNTDLTDLQALYPQQVQIAFIDMSYKTKGYFGGICHTKLWIVDDTHFYTGSANMDWRAYSEVICSRYFLMLFRT